MYRIMAVEDDPIMQSVLRDTIRPEFEFVLSPNGREALESASREKPDLILLDVHLPDMNGMEVCKHLKSDSRTRHIPVLMLTGEARTAPEQVNGLDNGAEDYLLKPISPKVLLSRIRSILKVLARPT